jgi:hypothetical protein
MKLSAIGGLISVAFLSVLLLVAFGAAFHYWQQLQLPRMSLQKRQRIRKLMRRWILAAIVIAVIGLGGTAVYLFAPTAILIQPPDRPYVYYTSVRLAQPLEAGKNIVIQDIIENTSAVEAVVTIGDGVFWFTKEVEDASRGKVTQDQFFDLNPRTTTSTLGPKRTVTGHLDVPIHLSTAEIEDLKENRAKLYFMTKGEYRAETDKKTTYQLELCRVYNPKVPGSFAYCPDDLPFKYKEKMTPTPSP